MTHPRNSLTALVLAGMACGVSPVAPHPFTPRPATTPIQVCWLETAGAEAPGAFGAAGFTHARHWDATTSALLVRHPKGDILIDTGMAADAHAQAEELSRWGRFVFSQTAGRNEVRASLTTLLANAGVQRVKAVILSHAHPDHAGGISLVPEAMIYVAAAEKDFMTQALARKQAAVLPAQARAALPRVVPIPFERRPYANYDESFDVFGDGTVVVVPTPGHTPGSVATFVNLGARRLVHVGDIINLQESVTRAAPKSFVMRELTDEDIDATKVQVGKLVELHKEDPALWILPAHDRVAYEGFFGPMAKGSVSSRCVSSEGH